MEMVRPPMTAMARGWSIWEPEPSAKARGNMPVMAARAVMTMGRRRRRAAWIMASRGTHAAGTEALIGVEQEDAVFGDDADHHDQSHEGRDVEGGAGDEEREDDAGGGEDRGDEDGGGRGEAAELGEEDAEDEHQGEEENL